MKLIKLIGYSGKPIYINPAFIKRITEYDNRVDVEMIGDNEENFHYVQTPIDEILKLIEDGDAEC